MQLVDLVRAPVLYGGKAEGGKKGVRGGGKGRGGGGRDWYTIARVYGAFSLVVP